MSKGKTDLINGSFRQLTENTHMGAQEELRAIKIHDFKPQV